MEVLSYKARGAKRKRKYEFHHRDEAFMEEEDDEDDEDDDEDDENEEAVAAGWIGSPWDMPERPQINIDDLDLTRSYVNDSNLKYSIKSGSSRGLSRRQPRWTRNGKEPLTDCSKFPEGWNMNEPDLDPEDIDANIQRAKQRIEDNIMPHAFQWRLHEYEKKKGYRDQIISKWPNGLSWNVLQRLESLEFLQGKLELDDPYEQRANVKSITVAYKSKQLEINDLVTYWSHGTQISQPRPFNWDELLTINTHYEGSKGFWVEGYRIAVRIPGVKWWTELDFIFATGSDRMEIYDSDIPIICGPNNTTFRTIGSTQVYGSNTEAERQVIIVEVCLLDEEFKRMTPWTMIDCNIVPGVPRNPAATGAIAARVDGPVFRHLLYNCFVPDGHKNIFISITKRGMHLPKPLAVDEREPPSIGEGIINLETTSFRNQWPPGPIPVAPKNLSPRAKGVPGPKYDTWPTGT
ncbi:uncharacterized protein N7483_008357 [Penicillium malachiteum]|uniref:uncharacterized protein n=1 Tax=Penicillium malachiteum TaxID=1324776 RepID=UPI0025477B98|nr:uncharacterized protein N7483_008357 [Penicillium malachiteum]KAJ5720423.1 hypothetical protein N7483_008357 [Penicillium malachiteum]